MAGYIMTMGDIDALDYCIETGTYSTFINTPQRAGWGTAQEGTLADYFSMKEGDNIYFFIKRKVYGIGKLVNIKEDCKYLNYVGSDSPVGYTLDEYNNREPLMAGGLPENRFICTFKPSPYFFKKGVDMDDVLSSSPEKFKIFRAMWKVSFIKIDDEENKALTDIILKRNEDYITTGEETYDFNIEYHNFIEAKINQAHRLNAYNILLSAQDGTKIKHEMAIEAALCETLVKDNNTPFGKWDYISHQVVASPFKPIDYMDKMDIFGYKYIPGFKTVSKYLIIENKKDVATVEVIEQIMKYVDWVNKEYAHNDYSMVEAYIVASDFPAEVIALRDTNCVRNFTKGYRPTTACTWNNVKLIKYSYINNELQFEEVN